MQLTQPPYRCPYCYPEAGRPGPAIVGGCAHCRGRVDMPCPACRCPACAGQLPQDQAGAGQLPHVEDLAPPLASEKG